MKRYIQQVRAMTMRQRAVVAAYGIAFLTGFKSVTYMVGLLADARTSDLNAAGKYGFALGTMFGLVFLPAVFSVGRESYRRLGGKDRTAAAE